MDATELAKSLAGLAGIPFVVLLVSRTKLTFPRWPGSAWPSVAIFWGVVLNLALAGILGGDLYAAAVVGVIAGVFASERYDRGAPAAPVPRG